MNGNNIDFAYDCLYIYFIALMVVLLRLSYNYSLSGSDFLMADILVQTV